MDRTVLRAEAGMVYTDGSHGGLVVSLPPGESAEGWYQIPREEFETLRESVATEEDYQAALREFGVSV